MFLVSDFQGLYGLFVFLGLLAGVSAATFSVGMIHSTFWAPKENQGVAIGVFQGLGTAGASIFALVLPFMLDSVGLSFTYLIWVLVSLGSIVLMIVLLRDPPYLQLSRFVEQHKGKIVSPWEKEWDENKAAESSALLTLELESSKEQQRFPPDKIAGDAFRNETISLESLERLSSLYFKSASFPSGSMVSSFIGAAKQWHVWVFLLLQILTFGFAYFGFVVVFT